MFPLWLDQTTLLVALGLSLLFGVLFQANFQFKNRFWAGASFPWIILLVVLFSYNPWPFLIYWIIMIWAGTINGLINYELGKGFLKHFLKAFLLPGVGYLVMISSILELRGESFNWTNLKKTEF